MSFNKKLCKKNSIQKFQSANKPEIGSELIENDSEAKKAIDEFIKEFVSILIPLITTSNAKI